MRKEFKKQLDEDNKSYGIRLYSNKIEYGLSNKEIYDMYVSETGDNRKAESSTRGYFTNLIEGINIGYEKALSDREEDNLINELEEKRLELEKEKIRLQDQKREYRNYLRAEARFEHLISIMKESLAILNRVKPMLSLNTKRIGRNDRQAVLINSDWHTGIKEKNHWNEISVEILKERISKLQDRVLEYCERNEVSVLHLEILGDMVNGLIHVTTRISNEEDIISQTMICSEILSEMINNLANYIPNLKIYSATGNHGRCIANAKDSLDTENFERLITWYLKERLKDVENVEFYENIYDDNIIVYKFLNETIFAVHGHEDKVGKVISDLSSMLKIFPTEVHMGHYHSYYEKDDHDISVVVNGTASGVDKYAKHIRKTGRPSQTLMIYNEEGRECTYKIKL